MAIPAIVYDIADAFSNAKNRTADQIHRIMINKININLLRDTILPNLVDAKILTSRVAGQGTPGEVIMYTWKGLDQADHAVLNKIKSSSVLYDGLGATINSRGGNSK